MFSVCHNCCNQIDTWCDTVCYLLYPLFSPLAMAAAVRMPTASQPKSMSRPTQWNEEVEEAYRFQLAGYRDEIEYKEVHKTDHVSELSKNSLTILDPINKEEVELPICDLCI